MKEKNHLKQVKKMSGKRKKAIMFLSLALFLLLFLALIIFFYQEQKQKEISNSLVEEIQKETSEIEHSELSEAEKTEKKVLKLLNEMTLEEKIGQLFFITPEKLTGIGVAIQAGDTTKQMLEQYPVGGLIYFSQNIETPDQITSMIENSQSYSRIPLFIGIDEEGGTLVARIANNPNFNVEKFPNMKEIGATGDPNQAFYVGSTIGSYLHSYGFNMDFAPDADLLTNPNNSVIGERSFGSDPTLVGTMTAQAVKGFQQENVSAVIKHFPGHGDTKEDSHTGAAIVTKTLDELRMAEFIPFQSGIEAGVDGVMVGHLQVPQVTGTDTPATLSPIIITDILRNELGFQGLVITDSLSMGAITQYYSSDEAAVLALQAGTDILLMPEDFPLAYQGVLNAVSSGTLSEERIDKSVKRILTVKYNRGIIE